MATTFSAMPLQRPKKVVRYGKASSGSTYNTQHIDSWLDDDSSIIEPKATAEKRVVTKRRVAQKREAIPESKVTKLAEMRSMEIRAGSNKGALKPAKSREKKQDMFDVPSSDDEVGMEYELKTQSPARFKSRRLLVDNTDSKNSALAPWEKPYENPRAGSNGVSAQNLAVTAQEPGPKVTKAMRKTDIKTTPDVAVSSDPEPSSATARLAARRLQSKTATPSDSNEGAKPAVFSAKRAGYDGEVSTSPHKRARKSPQSEPCGGDSGMDDGPLSPAHHSPRGRTNSYDISDVLVNDDDHVITPKRRLAQSTMKNARKGKPVSMPRSQPKKDVSALARVAETLAVDTNSTDAPSRSPSLFTSRSSTPHRSVTPARSDSSSRPSSRGVFGTTPKQTQQWNQLLPDSPLAPTPSSLAMHNLTLDGRRRSQKCGALAKLSMTKSKSDIPEVYRRRTRLVDRLKASAESSSEDSGVESDVEMEDIGSPEIVPEIQKGVHETSAVGDRSSQSQSQGITAEIGAKVTYAKMRSYLPEDSLEEGLMFDLPSLTSQVHPTLVNQTSNSHTASQKSAFDLDDSEDDGTAGRMRTVHELRAAGRMDRFLRDTEALLEDISDHGISARSRRRSAFIDLALKLTENGYVERFLGQGFEQKLLAECAAPPDEVGDVALAATFAVFLASEPPQHVVISLKDGDLLGWASKQLHLTTSFTKMTEDRRNNMSKVAQDGVFEFVEKLKSLSGLWEKSAPTNICPRLVALSVLDQLVGRLRRIGDRSELLDDNQISSVTNRLAVDNLDSAETLLAMSVLESLSTSALTLAWPREVVGKIATATSQFIHQISGTYPAQHALFLAYRLMLNLTNANPRNCAFFSSSELVSDLILAVENGFTILDQDEDADEVATVEWRAINLDLLILSIGVMINLAEHSAEARKQAASTVNNNPANHLSAIVRIFQQGQQRVEEAESVEESVNNVAFGYLAIMLANLCLDPSARGVVVSGLPGKNLGLLVAAVEEFVRHHQRVDMLGALEGGEGREVQGAFTEKLKEVLDRLTEIAEV